jgi:DNA-binding XRE family transcriptional regulator
MKEIKQIDLAIGAGVSVNTISSIESHDYFPTAQVRNRICKALGVEHEAVWKNVSVGNK